MFATVWRFQGAGGSPAGSVPARCGIPPVDEEEADEEAMPRTNTAPSASYVSSATFITGSANGAASSGSSSGTAADTTRTLLVLGFANGKVAVFEPAAGKRSMGGPAPFTPPVAATNLLKPEGAEHEDTAGQEDNVHADDDANDGAATGNIFSFLFPKPPNPAHAVSHLLCLSGPVPATPSGARATDTRAGGAGRSSGASALLACALGGTVRVLAIVSC
jgi:hypothetical protein